MRRSAVRAARLLALPTLVLVAVAVLAPGRRELAARIFALLVAGATLALLLGALRRSYPATAPLRRRAPVRRFRPEPPRALERLEHETSLGVDGAFELHYRLRPRLRTLALGLLASHSGISLDREPERARRLLGEETWELVRHDRPPPEDRLAGGLPLPTLRKVVDSLEQI